MKTPEQYAYELDGMEAENARLRAELAAAGEALEAAYDWPRLAHFDETEPVGPGSIWDRDVKPKLEKALAAITQPPAAEK